MNYLDHDKSLSSCLRSLESAYQTLPSHLYNSSIHELRAHLSTEKDAKTRELLKTVLTNCDKQTMLLIKQMDIGLPYDRDEFKKCMTHPDIKLRRDLCFKLIKSFDKNVEMENIESVVGRLLTMSKYKQNQPRIVVGRESRAFGNQAYLFANSKLIEIDEKVLYEDDNGERKCNY